MTTTTSDVSAILGRYMLQGWTLTDVNCPKSDCIGCPLMRSKAGSEFCARCDGGPVEDKMNASPAASSNASIPDPTLTRSRTTTPPTPILPPQETEAQEIEPFNPIASPEVLESRRIQSDLASTRIGQLLLQGWTLLDASCENGTCWAIPLMRSPKRIPTSDPSFKRKWCVICEQYWQPTGLGSQHPASTNTGVPNSVASSSSTLPDRSSTNIRPSTAATFQRFIHREADPVQPAITSTSAHRSDTPPPSSEQHSTLDPQVLLDAKQAIEGAVTFMSRNLKSITETRHAHPAAVLQATEDLGKALEIYRKL